MANEAWFTESMEDYLEMFYRIVERQGYIRSAELSEAIKVQPSSVTRMLQKLHAAGYISYEKYHNIALTNEGLIYGRFLVWRDETLKSFFRLFGEAANVEEQVEGVEHYITPAAMKIFQMLIFYFREDPQRLAGMKKYQNQYFYPQGENLANLRAWLFKHDLDK
jgi:Mn-dependent DtxR family transcriptional regulator